MIARGPIAWSAAVAVLAFASPADAARKAPLRAPLPAPKVVSQDRIATEPTDAEVTSEAVRERLLEQLLKAANEGIVEFEEFPDPAGAVQNTAEAMTPSELSHEGADSVVSNVLGPVDREEDVSAEAATIPASDPDVVNVNGDEKRAESQPSDQKNVEPLSGCLASDALNLPVLGDGVSAYEHIAELRAKMLGEFDMPDPAAAEELARAYLSAGLTEEARHISTLYISDQETLTVINDLVALLDGKAPMPSWLADESCVGDQAMWRGYGFSRTGRHELALAAERMSGAALSDLPDPLKQRVAANLGMSAVSTGDWDTAQRLGAVSELAGRDLATEHPDMFRLRAELAIWRGEWQEAEAALHDAVANGSSDAVLKLAEIARQRAVGIAHEDSGLQADLAALSLRERGSQIGVRASEERLRLRARAVSRQETLEDLHETVARALVPADRHSTLIAELSSDQWAGSEGEPLALIYLAEPDHFDKAIDQTAFRQSLIDSLVDNNLPTLAEQLVRKTDQADAERMARLADAMIKSGETEAALGIVRHLPNTPGMARLIGETLAANGFYAEARPYLLSVIQNESLPADQRGSAARTTVAAMSKIDDVSAAVEAARTMLSLDIGEGAATDLALLALDSGERELPSDAARELSKDGTDIKGYQSLFKPPLPDGVNSATAATDSKEYLRALDAEIELLMELINDG